MHTHTHTKALHIHIPMCTPPHTALCVNVHIYICIHTCIMLVFHFHQNALPTSKSCPLILQSKFMPDSIWCVPAFPSSLGLSLTTLPPVKRFLSDARLCLLTNLHQTLVNKSFSGILRAYSSGRVVGWAPRPCIFRQVRDFIYTSFKKDVQT